MKAKFINEESLEDIFKPRGKVNKENFDKLPLLEIIEMIENRSLITSEGYGGENKLGFIPEYVMQRLRAEGTYIQNSEHSWNTWDSYSLMTIPELKEPTCIMIICNAKTAGSSYALKIVDYRKEIVTNYYVK